MHFDIKHKIKSLIKHLYGKQLYLIKKDCN